MQEVHLQKCPSTELSIYVAPVNAGQLESITVATPLGVTGLLEPNPAEDGVQS